MISYVVLRSVKVVAYMFIADVFYSILHYTLGFVKDLFYAHYIGIPDRRYLRKALAFANIKQQYHKVYDALEKLKGVRNER